MVQEVGEARDDRGRQNAHHDQHHQHLHQRHPSAASFTHLCLPVNALVHVVCQGREKIIIQTRYRDAKSLDSTAHPSKTTVQRQSSWRAAYRKQNRMVNNLIFPRFQSAVGRQRGFTLVELLVTIAVAAVILAIGVPSFRGTIASNRLTSLTNDLVGTLAQARSEAIRRGVRITVCMSTNGTACATVGDWSAGWIVFVDTTRAGLTAAVDAGETVLSYTQPTPTNTVVRGGASVAQYVSFSSDGTARTLAGGALPGGAVATLRVCETSTALPDATRARDVAISSVGRVETSTPATVSNACAAPT